MAVCTRCKKAEGYSTRNGVCPSCHEESLRPSPKPTQAAVRKPVKLWHRRAAVLSALMPIFIYCLIDQYHHAHVEGAERHPARIIASFGISYLLPMLGTGLGVLSVTASVRTRAWLTLGLAGFGLLMNAALLAIAVMVMM